MSRRLHSLQALRGAACLLVVLFHLSEWEQEYGVRTPVLTGFSRFGFAGVDLFFVLSGFIIAHTQGRLRGRPAAVPGYLARRAWRIYPTYWAALIIGGLVWWRAFDIPAFGPGTAADWWHWATLAPGLPVNIYVAPAWTLAYELMFYLGFAVVLAVPRPVGPWLLFGWGVAVAGVVAAGRPSDPWAELLVSPFVFEFLAGCGIAWAIHHGRLPRRWWPLVLIAVVWVAAGLVVGGHRVLVFGPPAALFVAAAVSAEQNGWHGGPRWLRATGDASYSIYLIHCTVGRVAVVYGCLIPHTRAAHLLWLIGTFAGCLIAGWVLHLLVERPVLRVLSKPKPGQRPAAGA